MTTFEQMSSIVDIHRSIKTYSTIYCYKVSDLETIEFIWIHNKDGCVWIFNNVLKFGSFQDMLNMFNITEIFNVNIFTMKNAVKLYQVELLSIESINMYKIDLPKLGDNFLIFPPIGVKIVQLFVINDLTVNIFMNGWCIHFIY